MKPITKSQRIQLLSVWWPDACAAAGWNPADRERRLEVLSDAVGRPLTSANELNSTTDIDAIKQHLLAISQPADLNAQVNQANMPRARLLYAIGKLTNKLSETYVHAIMRDRFGHTDLDRLNPEQLAKLRNTLHSRTYVKRAKSGDPF